MSLDVLRFTARKIVDQLAHGDIELLLSQCAKSRLTCEDLHRIIRNYGRNLVPPPSDDVETLDAIEVKGATLPTWSVRVPLWTKEEGRSDLTLELTIAVGTGNPIVELEDLHVL